MAQKKDSAALSGAKDILAGSFGGFAQLMVGHPLDTIKVRLQTQTPLPDGTLKYKGTLDCFKLTVKEEGLTGLYKGVVSPMAGVSALNALMFFAYGQSKTVVSGLSGNNVKDMNVLQYTAAGMISGFAVSFIEGPVDLIKAKMQAQTGSDKAPTAAEPGKIRYANTLDCARHIVKNYGLRGVYQGLGATFLRDIPAYAVYFGFYEGCRQLFTKPGESVQNLPASRVLLAGGVGGVMFWLLTYPADVVKSKIQTDHSDPAKRKYKGITDCFKQVYKAEGLGGFTKGFVPCLLRSFPANAVCFYVYEYVRRHLG